MGDSIDPGNLRDLIQTAQRIQAEVARVQEELSSRTAEGESGGGLVRCIVSCTGEVLQLSIDPAVGAFAASTDSAKSAGGEPYAMLAELIVGAVNVALSRAKDLAKDEMARVTGGLPMPPGMFGS